MATSSPSPHTAFFYATQEAYFAHVVEFIGAAARNGDHLIVIMASARWDAIVARLDSGAINLLAGPHRGLVIIEVESILDQTVRHGIFERARFDAAFPALLGNGHSPKRVYSEAASTLVGLRNLPAALALEHAEQEIAHDNGTRISCSFDLQQFSEEEHDWQVRSVINAHHDAEIEPNAWTQPVPPDAARRSATEAELILLWDDYPDTRRMYAEALTFNGYRVITAADAREALALATAYRPDVLVLDVRLPARLAVRTMRRLRARPDFSAPILALTAHAFREERAHIFERGFDVVLSKPCLPDTLVGAVANALSRPRNR